MIAMVNEKQAAEIRNDPSELFRLHSYVAEFCANKAWSRYRYRIQGQVDRDDLLQLCYFSLHVASKTYSPEMGRFEGYAYRCCKNAVVDVMRALRNREVSNFERLSNCPSKPQEIGTQALMTAVYSLPRDMCTVVLMSYGLAGYKEHTQKEIAEKTGWTRSRVQLLSRAAKDALGAILSV